MFIAFSALPIINSFPDLTPCVFDLRDPLLKFSECSALYCWHGYAGEKHALALGVECQLNQQVFTCCVSVSHVRRLDWLCKLDCKLSLLRRNAKLSCDL